MYTGGPNRYNGFTGVNNISIALPAFPTGTTRYDRQSDLPGGVPAVGDDRRPQRGGCTVAARPLPPRTYRPVPPRAAKEAMEASLRSIETKKKDSKGGGKEEQRKGGKEKEEDKEKKEKESIFRYRLYQILGGAMDILNAITERHFDIRSWQSLPAEIFYQRIPLEKGSMK